MILTQKVILKEIQQKNVQVIPFDPKSVGPASIDLTLDKTIRVFKNLDSCKILADSDYKTITKPVNITKGYVLKPGQLVMGITKEKIILPDNICGWLNSRSRFARLGLMSHITAPFICPGVANKQVLEIYNCTQHNLILYPDIKICQLVLQRCEGNAKYTGKFKNQKL